MIRDKYNQSVYEYEQEMEESEQKKMQLIRLQRNFIQHETDIDFVAVSEKQLQFIDTLIKRIELEDGCAKDAMVTVAKFGCCKDTDTINVVAKTLYQKKHGQVLIVDAKTNEAIGFLDQTKVVQIIATGGKLSEKVSKHKALIDTNFLLTETNMLLKDLEMIDCNKFVVANKNRSVVGVIIK